MPYLAGGKSYRKAVGSRAEVMHGNAHHTSGGLRKRDLKYVGRKADGTRRIVAVKASAVAALRYKKQMRNPEFRETWNEWKIAKKRRSDRKKRKSDKKKKHSAKKHKKHSAKKHGHRHSAKKHHGHRH